MRGAVLYGLSLDQPMAHIPSVNKRVARFSYGVTVAERFVAGVHPPGKMYYDSFYGEFMCSDRMNWFVQKVQIPFL